jgi:DNA-binding XRE family transcriptional regulator
MISSDMARPRHGVHRELFSLRINAGLSREELGRRIGVSKETIRKAEYGFVPTVPTQYLIAQAFGKRPLDLWPLEVQKIAA